MEQYIKADLSFSVCAGRWIQLIKSYSAEEMHRGDVTLKSNIKKVPPLGKNIYLPGGLH